MKINKRIVLLQTGAALFLFGCASFAERYEEETIPLSAEATKEISRQFAGKIPKIVFAISDEGKVVHFRLEGRNLPEIKFPREVGTLLESPKVITITHTSDSPDETYVCHHDRIGKYHCH